MKPNPDSDLARIREARIRISEEFQNDPELLIKHYMELQERHRDRLVFSREAGAKDQPKGPISQECSES